MRRGETITTDRLFIRNWNKSSDGESFFRLNNDPQVMRFFPGRRTRIESDALLDRIERQINKNGYSWSAILLRESHKIIGFGGIARVPSSFPNGPSAEIGWRFLPETWGNGYATEMAGAVLKYGFEELLLPEILSFAVIDNKKSFNVMERIGMHRFRDGDFDHPNINTKTHPELLRHHCHRISQKDWKQQKTAG